jgi:hypothetical protein
VFQRISGNQQLEVGVHCAHPTADDGVDAPEQSVGDTWFERPSLPPD